MIRIHGLLIPWDVPGQVGIQRSRRTVSAPKGCITWPHHKSWVKYYRGHRGTDRGGIPIGYLDELHVDDTGLWCVLNLGSSPAAVDALRAMREKTEDGLSVELDALKLTTTGKEIEHGRIDGIALVPRPGFMPARVHRIEEVAA